MWIVCACVMILCREVFPFLPFECRSEMFHQRTVQFFELYKIMFIFLVLQQEKALTNPLSILYNKG